jgi:hypothetical protein
MRSITSHLVSVALVAVGLAMPLAAGAEPSVPAADADVQARVAQLRALLASDQGSAILGLLGDPQVLQAVLQGAETISLSQVGSATAGEMMDIMLGRVRTRLKGLAAELLWIPDELAQAWDWLRAQLSGPELLRLPVSLAVFLAGGIGAHGSRVPGASTSIR